MNNNQEDTDQVHGLHWIEFESLKKNKALRVHQSFVLSNSNKAYSLFKNPINDGTNYLKYLFDLALLGKVYLCQNGLHSLNDSDLLNNRLLQMLKLAW